MKRSKFLILMVGVFLSCSLGAMNITEQRMINLAGTGCSLDVTYPIIIVLGKTPKIERKNPANESRGLFDRWFSGYEIYEHQYETVKIKQILYPRKNQKLGEWTYGDVKDNFQGDFGVKKELYWTHIMDRDEGVRPFTEVLCESGDKSENKRVYLLEKNKTKEVTGDDGTSQICLSDEIDYPSDANYLINMKCQLLNTTDINELIQLRNNIISTKNHNLLAIINCSHGRGTLNGTTMTLIKDTLRDCCNVIEQFDHKIDKIKIENSKLFFKKILIGGGILALLCILCKSEFGQSVLNKMSVAR